MDKIQTTWQLEKYFYSSISDKQITEDLKNAEHKISEIIHKYKNKIKEITPSELKILFEKENEIGYILEKISTYFSLVYAKDTQNQEIIKRQSEFSNKMTEYSLELEFINQEIKELGVDKLLEFSKNEALKEHKYYLESLAKNLKYLLSEKEEKAIALKENATLDIIHNLYEEYTGNLRFKMKIEGKTEILTQEEIRKYLQDENEQLRKSAFNAIRKVFKKKENQIIYGNLYKSILKNWNSEIRLRNYDEVLSQRAINESIEEKTILILIENVKKKNDLVERYFNLKAKLLKKEKLDLWDIYAPIRTETKSEKYPFEKSVNMYLETMKEFDEEFLKYSEDMLTEGRCDAFPEPNKMGGAFAEYKKDVESFILLNHKDNLSDLLTLAHELGHAIHGHLSQKQNAENFTPPYFLAETASIFNETLLIEKLLEKITDKHEKIKILCKTIEEMIATIFVQIQYTSFELEVHTRTKNGEELGFEEFNKFWTKERKKLFGNSIENIGKNSTGWSGIPHIFRYPFYCYSYSLGNLISLALFEQYKKNPAKMVSNYKQILGSGNNQDPTQMLQHYGIDINSKKFYDDAFEYFEKKIVELEELV